GREADAARVGDRAGGRHQRPLRPPEATGLAAHGIGRRGRAPRLAGVRRDAPFVGFIVALVDVGRLAQRTALEDQGILRRAPRLETGKTRVHQDLAADLLPDVERPCRRAGRAGSAGSGLDVASLPLRAGGVVAAALRERIAAELAGGVLAAARSVAGASGIMLPR